ncbi:MAG: hypothetical protein ACOWW1_10280 [archaeon]
MSQTMMDEPATITLQESFNQLPEDFISYIEKMTTKKGHRKSFLALSENPLELTLEICEKAYIKNKTPRQIATHLTKKLNTKVSYVTIFRFLQKIETWRNQIADYLLIVKPNVIISARVHPLFVDWENKIRRSGHLSVLCHLSPMANILEGKIIPDFKCRPEKFDLNEAQRFVTLWLKANPDKKKVKYGLRMAIRHFLQVAREINIPRGFGGVYGLSGEKQSYGKYAHVKMTDSQIDTVRKFFITKNDLFMLTFFDYAIESGARYTALVLTETSKATESESGIYTRVYESKTNRHWTKYILKKFHHGTQANETLSAWIQKRKQAGKRFFFTDNDKHSHVWALSKEITTKLRDAYKHAGITEKYVYKKPVHALRHASAQLWLKRTNYDYGLVAKVCGWDDVQTLINCYGELTAETLEKKLASIRGD